MESLREAVNGFGERIARMGAHGRRKLDADASRTEPRIASARAEERSK